MFADYPPCPYAKQARLAGKVEFVELTDMEPDSNIWTSIDHFDFNNKDVLVIIIGVELLEKFMRKGVNYAWL